MFLKFWIVKNFYTEPVYKYKYLRTSIKPDLNMTKPDIYNSKLSLELPLKEGKREPKGKFVKKHSKLKITLILIPILFLISQKKKKNKMDYLTIKDNSNVKT